jgi:hypothetical protein
MEGSVKWNNGYEARAFVTGLSAATAIVAQTLGCGSPGRASPEDAGRPGDDAGPADSATAPDVAAADAEASNDAGLCSGPVTEALIDDMTGANISLAPPPCATPEA